MALKLWECVSIINMYIITLFKTLCFSSISIWCKNCDELSLQDEERSQLDAFIDQLYDNLDKGRVLLTFLCFRFTQIIHFISEESCGRSNLPSPALLTVQLFACFFVNC